MEHKEREIETSERVWSKRPVTIGKVNFREWVRG